MKTLIIGLGNPIMTDDGVGVRVAEEMRRRLSTEDTEIISGGLAGIDLLEILSGYDRVFIIDAIQTGGEPGKVYRLSPESLEHTRNTVSPHDIDLNTTLDLGRTLGLSLPKTIDIIAIEAADTSSFGEKCTAEVENAVDVCVKMVLEELGNRTQEKRFNKR